jgi:hypothetical protein
MNAGALAASAKPAALHAFKGRLSKAETDAHNKERGAAGFFIFFAPGTRGCAGRVMAEQAAGGFFHRIEALRKARCSASRPAPCFAVHKQPLSERLM